MLGFLKRFTARAHLSDMLFDVRWLSRGKVLERFVTLRKEVSKFLKKNRSRKHILADKLVDKKWILAVAYLLIYFINLIF